MRIASVFILGLALVALSACGKGEEEPDKSGSTTETTTETTTKEVVLDVTGMT